MRGTCIGRPTFSKRERPSDFIGRVQTARQDIRVGLCQCGVDIRNIPVSGRPQPEEFFGGLLDLVNTSTPHTTRRFRG